MYGYRARIGYTSPPMLTEVFTYEFYKIAPAGVTLSVTSLAVVDVSAQELQDSYQISLRAAREMGRAGVNLVVLGGVPINLSQGVANFEGLNEAMAKECGVPVTTSLTCQIHAFQQLGARRVSVINTQDDARGDWFDYLEQAAGLRVVGVQGAGCAPIDWGRLPAEANVRVARELMQAHPETDTLYFPCPHRAIADEIEGMEREFGVKVMTASQAILWEALRRCGVREPINGFGRLLREPWDF